MTRESVEINSQSAPQTRSAFSQGHGRQCDSLLISRVHVGFDRGEFQVAFQPIVDVGTGALQAVECLLRWQHPDYGLLLPGCFTAAFEDHNAAQRAAHLVIERAVRELANLQRRGLRLPRMSVNIEPFQLLDATLAPTIEGLCTRYGVSPSLIELEMVETEDVSSLFVTDVFTRPLTQLGVRLALDDFGSGYASLRTLAVARFDTVKLAGELFRGVPQSHRYCTVVAATLDLLARLDVSIVVEGVETQEQLHWLLRYPEIQAQGFHIGRPKMSLTEAIDIAPSH